MTAIATFIYKLWSNIWPIVVSFRDIYIKLVFLVWCHANFFWISAFKTTHHSEIASFEPLIIVCGAIPRESQLGTRYFSWLQNLGSQAHNHPQVLIWIFVFRLLKVVEIISIQENDCNGHIHIKFRMQHTHIGPIVIQIIIRDFL